MLQHLLKSKPGTPHCPHPSVHSSDMRLNRLERKSFENDWTWLAEWFGGPDALDKLDAIVPEEWLEDTAYDGSPEAARRVFDLVCTRMGVDPAEVDLLIHDVPQEREAGGLWFEDEEETDLSDELDAAFDPELAENDPSPDGEKEVEDAEDVDAEQDPEAPSDAKDHEKTDQIPGRPFAGRNAAGLYEVHIEQIQLEHFESLVAMLAHELASILLLGGGLIEEEDETLIDQVPIWFGFGIFGGNALLSFHQDLDGWHWSGNGSLTAGEYAYAMGLRGFIRGEEKPEWMDQLSPDIRQHFKEAEVFLLANEDDVFQNLEILEEEENADPGFDALPESDPEALEEARRRRYGDQDEDYFEPDWSI